MKAEIIAVGTEILTGQITNTNAQFLSEEFAKLGIDVFFQTAVGDNEERLLSIIDLASKRSDLVVLCGGLGPTEDDLTKQTLAKYLGRNLVFDEQASKRLDEFFATRPQFTRTANNERQAQLIEGSTPLQNSTGLAVGGVIEVDGVTYVVLPGPPSELKPMVWDYLVPLLSSDHKQLYSRVLRFFGIGESQLVTVLSDLIDNQTADIVLEAVEGVRYTVPETINIARMDEELTVRFRVSNVYKNCYISVYFDEVRMLHKKRQIMAPGEMEDVRITREQLMDAPDLKKITVKIEEA